LEIEKMVAVWDEFMSNEGQSAKSRVPLSEEEIRANTITVSMVNPVWLV
jgi:hypothetical protein